LVLVLSIFPDLAPSQGIADHADTLTLVEESCNVPEGRIAIRRFSLDGGEVWMHLYDVRKLRNMQVA
jgi:hypothetical protein